MLHWHSSHKSSKPKLPKEVEVALFYTLLGSLVAFLAVIAFI